LYDGIWLVTVISSVSFSLVNSTFTTALSNQGNIVLDYTGVGEIGVMTYSEVTDAYTYTRLLRSKELGFCREAQIDVDAEINALGKTLYFNQYKYQPPRVFYYNGDYVTDGALNYVSSENRYGYGSIAIETKNVLNIQTATLDLVSVNEGGAVKAGNKQYFIRLMGDEGSLFGTDFHAFTNNVNVYSASLTGAPELIFGDKAGVSTNKKVVLRASNLTSEVYSQVELCVAEWFGDAVTFSVVRREQITGDTVLLEHTGFETTRNLSDEEVNRIVPEIDNIGGQRIVDNRLVYHDITYKQERDFIEWASSFEHVIERRRISGEGGLDLGYKFGGYLDPENTFNVVGLSWYETYRFGVRVYFKDGGASKVFWVDDIRLDTSSFNITNPNRRAGGVSSPGISTPSLFDISDSNGDFIAPCVRFSNINLDFVIDGVRVRDLIGKIEFLMVDLESGESLKEILYSGIGIIGLNGIVRAFENINGSLNVQVGSLFSDPNGIVPNVFPFPFASGQSLMRDGSNNPYGFAQAPPYSSMVNAFNTFYRTNLTPLSGPTGGALSGSYFLMDSTLFLYSNDLIFGGDTYSFVNGDRLINWGRSNSGSSFFSKTSPSFEDSFVRDFNSFNNAIFPDFSDVLSGGVLEANDSRVFSNHNYPVD